MKNLIVLALLVFSLQGCGKDNDGSSGGYGAGPAIPPGVGPGPLEDGSVVRGTAIVNVSSDQDGPVAKLFKGLSFFPIAYAATGTTTVTYTNAAAVSFTINVASLGAGSMTGSTLSLGSVSLSSLDDNSLKVCGVGGTTKCTKAIIRVYTTGSVAGFVETTDLYGAPVYAGSLNPTTAVGLTSANSVETQNVTIAGNKNRIRLVDFPTPTYAVSSDFSNAGAGSYSMTMVVEYILSL